MVSLLGLLFNVEMPDYKAIFFNEILWVAQLNNISVTQFKNYPSASFSFNERVVGICGKKWNWKNEFTGCYLLSLLHQKLFCKNGQP
jgi:hypothetical protein